MQENIAELSRKYREEMMRLYGAKQTSAVPAEAPQPEQSVVEDTPPPEETLPEAAPPEQNIPEETPSEAAVPEESVTE